MVEQRAGIAANWIRGAALAASVVIGAATATPSQTLAGRVSVIDGDTIELHGDRIRLFGMDAPEHGQTCQTASGKTWRCGTSAARGLDALVSGKTVTCAGKYRDRYRRLVAVCRVNGEDIGATLVRQGLAVAYRRYSLDYVSAEDQARAAGLGLWGGPFVMPDQYRHRK